MNSTIVCKENIDQKEWEDFYFEPISIATLRALTEPESYKNSFTFRDALLKALEKISDKKVLKLLLITPDLSTKTGFYGIAYLEGKEIRTATLQQTAIFKH